MGGWEQWCQEVADAFRERGHDVWVLTSNFLLERIRQQEPRIRRLLYLESDIEHYSPLSFILQTGRRDRHNVHVVRETIREADPEIIFVWGMWQLDPRLATLAETLRPGRVAYYFCGYWPIDLDPHTSYWSMPEEKRWVAVMKRVASRPALAKQRARMDGLPAFRHAAFVSRAVQRILEDGGITFGYRQVIYGGISLRRFRRGQGNWADRGDNAPMQILYAGSLSKAKGVDTLLQATKLLAEHHDHSRFHLDLAGAGHPEFEAWARRFAEVEGLAPYVNFLGRRSRQEMPALLRGYDVLAFPSAWQEPLARMMMEGLAAGLALVSTTTGGTGEVLVDGENSLTFEAGDAGALARQLERLMNEPDLIEHLGRSGAKTAESLFDFERMVADLETFVSRLL
jgi:glycosyltransferase involved in cell wall biosynthesis